MATFAPINNVTNGHPVPLPGYSVVVSPAVPPPTVLGGVTPMGELPINPLPGVTGSGSYAI